MTREDIIRMAREAGMRPNMTESLLPELERFAELVAAEERKEVNRLKDLCQEMLKELYVYRGCEYLKDVTASMREMAQKAREEK